MNSIKTVGIIGAGNVGLTLAILAQRGGRYTVKVGSRNPVRAARLLAEFGCESEPVEPSTAAQCDLVLLTVPDAAIRPVCESLANEFKAGAVVVHCSGALSSDELTSAGDVSTGSMHPLQTFPSVAGSLPRVAGTFCYFEGDTNATAAMQEFAANLAMRPVEIQKSAKTLYHAAAVMACNYLSALVDASLQIGEAAGIGRKTMWQSLDPLVTATLENIRSNGPSQALTGPIVRGDAGTVCQHLDSLTAADTNLADIYLSLGRHTTRLAERSGRVSADQLTALKAALGEESNN